MSLENIEKMLKTDHSVSIIALGDSLTYGWMTEYGYLDYLARLLEKKYPNSSINLINRGIPGDTASDGLRRLSRDVIDNQPDLVLVQFALNDAYSGYSVEEFRMNMESIISRILKETEAEIALITSSAPLNPVDMKIAAKFYNEIQITGKKFNLPVADVNSLWMERISSGIDHRSLVQSDGVHPTEKGYELMAEAVFTLF